MVKMPDHNSNSTKIFMKEQQDRNRQSETDDEGQRGDAELASNAANEPTPIYLTPDSTLQSPEEDRRDKSMDPRNDESISVSNDDLRETDASRLAGSDRAGTSERKDNSV
jgi:hypothetical protein